MTQSHHCPQCGAELGPDAPQEMCPECLLKAGQNTQGASQNSPDAEAAAPTPGFVPPTPEELAPQFPQLEVLELIGHGGMGAVYKARQTSLDRLVALKIVRPEAAKDPTFAERFAREARALASLSHPSIVAVHDFGEAGGKYYFIMEFVEGLNLRQVLQRGELQPREALAIVPQICDALQFAHDEGVVHRDIKPENVLLDTKGRVKIADFGLAKLLDRASTEVTLTQTGQAMGTPHYVAPEQMEHPIEVDHRADIYSLGVVFYEMLTGELPIGRFAPPSQKVQVDVRLDEVVLRSLEKEPEKRYQHASEVKTEVESIAGGDQAAASAPPAATTQEGGGSTPRFCRLPVWGLVWGALGCPVGPTLLVYWMRCSGEASPGPHLWQWVVLVACLLLGASAPFGCTALGCLGISRIRNSCGRLIGMPLAVAVALLYPLLVLDGIVLAAASGDGYRLIGVVIAIVLDIYIVRAAWKAVRVAK